MSTTSKRHKRTRAQESSSAIERMYITMRHLFNRGFYKPMGVSGETLREALLLLRPEIYGSIGDEKAELEGLLYVVDRLPHGIEECTFINLTSDEGYANSHFKPIIPPKRRRNCYRIDKEQMNIEITKRLEKTRKCRYFNKKTNTKRTRNRYYAYCKYSRQNI